jgi:peptidoglycan hydrolase-like protein with peptidoglycan-binding domain
MKTNRLIYGMISICFLAFIVGPMFFGGVKNALAAEEMKKPAAKPEMATPMKSEAKPAMAAPMKSEAKPAMKAHKKMAKKAMKSEKVMAVQKALNNAGFKLKEDGMMGKHTRQALMKYQKDNNLKATGKADMETMAKLGIK